MGMRLYFSLIYVKLVMDMAYRKKKNVYVTEAYPKKQC